MAAFLPLMPMTEPPGCVAAPQRYKPGMGVSAERRRSHMYAGRISPWKMCPPVRPTCEGHEESKSVAREARRRDAGPSDHPPSLLLPRGSECCYDRSLARAHLALDVRGAEHLLVHDGVGDIGAVLGEAGLDDRPHLLAAGVPVPVSEGVRNVLDEA
jgi:hypothetical protein